MMLTHLIVGIAVVLVAIAAGLAYLVGPPREKVATLAGWALGLLIVQTATGMFLLTATEEGPGPLHIALPLMGLAVVALARVARSEAAQGSRAVGGRDAVLGIAYSVAAVGAAFALVTGLVSG